MADDKCFCLTCNIMQSTFFFDCVWIQVFLINHGTTIVFTSYFHCELLSAHSLCFCMSGLWLFTTLICYISDVSSYSKKLLGSWMLFYKLLLVCVCRVFSCYKTNIVLLCSIVKIHTIGLVGHQAECWHKIGIV